MPDRRRQAVRTVRRRKTVSMRRSGLRGGYYPDKNTGVLYKAMTDMEGKMALNYSQPMSEDMYNSLLSGERPFGDDPLGLDKPKGGGEGKGNEKNDNVKLPTSFGPPKPNLSQSGQQYFTDPEEGNASLMFQY